MEPTLDNIDQMEHILRNMYLDHQIDENKYQAGMISIACSYAMINKKEECRGLISRLSTDFIENTLVPYIENDPMLKAKALAVAEFLSEDKAEIDVEDSNIDLMLVKMDKNTKPS
jgi:hypothetical protein